MELLCDPFLQILAPFKNLAGELAPFQKIRSNSEYAR